MPMPHGQAGPGMPMMRGQAPIYSMNPSPNMVQGNSPGGQMMMPAQSPMGPTGHFVPSPQNPNVPSPQRMGMAPSPSQTSIRTPGSHNQSHNPEHQQTDEYLEKVRQLGKYIEPLRKMIAKIGNEDQEKLQKMKKLMDILSNPSKRLAYDVLLRCESVLEHMIRDGPPDSQQDQGSGGSSSINPILDSVLKLKNQKFANVHSSLLNHSLHSTFGPPLEAINGPEITISPPTKRRKRPLVDQPDELPDHIQGEVAQLHSQFKVTLDASQALLLPLDSIQLQCQLEDPHLPSVPPISVTLGPNYPLESSPELHDDNSEEYDTSVFLQNVRQALNSRVKKLPVRHTLTQLLTAWEMSVRASCSYKNSKFAMSMDHVTENIPPPPPPPYIKSEVS